MKTQFLLAPLALLLLAGCGHKSADQTPTAPLTVETPAPLVSAANATPAPAKIQIYRVRGQVAEVPANADFIVVKHETIPGFMPAMTMRLPLKNAADAAPLKPGDKIAFDMDKGNVQISNIEKLPASIALKLEP